MIMSVMPLSYVDSVAGTDYAGAIAQHAIGAASLNFPTDWQSQNINECMIEGINIQSDENLEWDIFIFSSSAFEEAVINSDKFRDFFNFPLASGIQIAAAGQFYYASPANIVAVPYRDLDNTGKIHVGVIPRTAGGKAAGATGEVKVSLALRPTMTA